MFNTHMQEAKVLIDRLGGPTKVAELLGILSEPGAVQRVSNWKRRGIPPRVLLDHIDVFRSELATLPSEPEHA